MFAVYCSGHGTRVLLFADNIEALVNQPDRVELHWRCTCGTAGMTHSHRGPRTLFQAA